MKKITLIALILLSLTLGAANNFAAGRKGLNVILLPHWSPRSVDNFLNTFKDSAGRCSKGSFSEIELGFLPYEYNPSTNYVNARSIVNCFRSGGKQVYVNVFLSFHAAGTSKNSEINQNAADFNVNFLRQYYNLINISVSPSLEDEGTDASFSSWASIVASKIDADKIGRVNLLRSPITSNTAITAACFGSKCFGGTRREFHGAFNQSGDIYSNDGNFVYYSPMLSNGYVERANSLLGDNPSPQYDLFDFIARTNASNNVVMLWRPAYNILRRYGQGGQVYYTRDGRDLSDAQTSINSTEVIVLREFFNIQ